MNSANRTCCICEAEADWVCVRTPNQGHLDYLCDHHFQSLNRNNPILAARYDHIAAVSPMDMQKAPINEESQIH